jgi:hypothetical protein
MAFSNTALDSFKKETKKNEAEENRPQIRQRCKRIGRIFFVQGPNDNNPFPKGLGLFL